MALTVPRKNTVVVTIGSVAIGGEQPIAVQSMTNTKTEEAAATIAQARRLEEAGCELVRVTVRGPAGAKNLPLIKQALKVPLIGDVHFDGRMALAALEAGCDKVRLNPGNLPRKLLAEICRKAARTGAALRLGINSGSLEEDLLEKHGYPTPEALVESALRWVEMAESCGFRRLVLSVKSSDVPTAVASYRRLSAACSYPLHLGITEAGKPPYGTLKSAVGLGALLLEGIGDTVRVSLLADPVEEVQAAFDILQATRRRVTRPEIIACPTCGRLEIDLGKTVSAVEAELQRRGITAPLKISLLGCMVNGPGEAKEADVGLAGGRGRGVLFRRGERVRQVSEAQFVPALMEEIERFLAEKKSAARAAAEEPPNTPSGNSNPTS